MKFEEILATINCSNRDTFKELTLIDKSSFEDDQRYNVYVYQYGFRYISVKVRDIEEDDINCASVVMEAVSYINKNTLDIEYVEDLSVKENRFYRIVRDTTVQTKTINPGGGYTSVPMKVPAGAVFKGTEVLISTTVYDGMPIKEATHTILIEGINLFQSNNQYLVTSTVSSLDYAVFSEISEKEYIKESKSFKARKPYAPKKGAFVNFLAR